MVAPAQIGQQCIQRTLIVAHQTTQMLDIEWGFTRRCSWGRLSWLFELLANTPTSASSPSGLNRQSSMPAHGNDAVRLPARWQ